MVPRLAQHVPYVIPVWRNEMTRDEAMMRITFAHVSDERTTLRVEGSVVTEWADLLAWECAGLLHAGVSLTLDLSGVDFVDRRGVESLRQLGREGVEIRCPSGAVASVLEAEGVLVNP